MVFPRATRSPRYPFWVPAGCMNCGTYFNTELSCPPATRVQVARRGPMSRCMLCLLAKWLFSGDFTAKSRRSKALTWYDSGFPRRSRDSNRDVHSGGFVQRWLNHPCHVLLVVSIFWLLWHFLQVGAGKGVHWDTHASASLNLTLVLPEVENKIVLNTARGGFRECKDPEAAALAGFHRLLSLWKSFAERSQDNCRTSD